MSPKDFFKIAIRCFALFSLIFGVIYSIFSILPQLLDGSVAVFFIGIATILFLIALVWLVFKYTDAIISVFNLDEGYDTEIFNFSNVEIKYCVEIALSLIGLYLIVAGLPIFIYEGFLYFKTNIQTSSFTFINEYTFDKDYFFSQLLSIITGWMIIKNRTWISKKLM